MNLAFKMPGGTKRPSHKPLSFPFFGIVAMLLLAAMVFTSPACGGDDDGCPLTCLNGGILDDKACECDCPDRYEGKDCGDQKTPDYILVTGITVKKFPFTFEPNLTMPDPWVAIRRGNASANSLRTGYFENASPGEIFVLIPDGSGKLDDPLTPFKLYLMDCDDADDCPGNSEEMGVIDFQLYSKTGGFPDILPLASPDGSIQVELSLTYVHE